MWAFSPPEAEIGSPGNPNTHVVSANGAIAVWREEGSGTAPMHADHQNRYHLTFVINRNGCDRDRQLDPDARREGMKRGMAMPQRLLRETLELERRRVLSLAGEMTLLASPASLPAPVTARGAQIEPDDPRLKAGRVVVRKHAGGLQCYAARPASATAPLGSVVVMHDILGLTPHYEDIARRFALEGFAVLAPDFASRDGGTPAELDPAREVVGMVTWPEMIADTNAAIAWLKMTKGR